VQMMLWRILSNPFHLTRSCSENLRNHLLGVDSGSVHNLKNLLGVDSGSVHNLKNLLGVDSGSVHNLKRQHLFLAVFSGDRQHKNPLGMDSGLVHNLKRQHLFLAVFSGDRQHNLVLVDSVNHRRLLLGGPRRHQVGS